MSSVDGNQHRSSFLTFAALVFSLAIPLGLFITFFMRSGREIGFMFWVYSSALLGAGLMLFIILALRIPYVDRSIVPILLMINGIGLVFVYRIDTPDPLDFYNSLAFKQLIAFAIGIVCCLLLLIFVRDYRFFRRYYWTSMIIGIGLMLLPMMPVIGREVNGSQLWINIAGFTLQPAEFAKIFLIIFFAGYLIERRDILALAGPEIFGIRFPRFRDLGPLLMIWGISLLVLIWQRDLGTSLLFFGLFIAMLYVATGKLGWIVIGLGLFVVGVIAAFIMFAHVRMRFEIWQNPFDSVIYDRSPGGSYQIVQGLFALGNGGLFGTGIGAGFPSLTPYADSDYIFSVIGEELGLVGILALLFLFFILGERIIRQGLGVRDGFGKLLAAGIGFSVILQVFVVAGGILRVIPLTGLTLPFISRGGSSLIANWILITMVLLISNQARQPFSVEATTTLEQPIVKVPA